MEKRACLGIYSENYRPRARRGVPTMNNEVTHPDVWTESDILMISFFSKNQGFRLVLNTLKISALKAERGSDHIQWS